MMPKFDVTADIYNVPAYMNNIELHHKDNCLHDNDDDDDDNAQINMYNFKHQQRQSRLWALLGTACVVILLSLTSYPKFSIPFVFLVNLIHISYTAYLITLDLNTFY
jgi:hypothetical protein